MKGSIVGDSSEITGQLSVFSHESVGGECFLRFALFTKSQLAVPCTVQSHEFSAAAHLFSENPESCCRLTLVGPNHETRHEL